jgi:hypothetical protein
MDVKVTRFGVGWMWVGFFAISRLTCVGTWRDLHSLGFRKRQIPLVMTTRWILHSR